MNESRVFDLRKKRTLIAMQEWLKQWQMPLADALLCPNCQSQAIKRRMTSKGGKRYHCSACTQDFSLEDVPSCHCTYPGMLSKCSGCKHYKDMVTYVSQRKPYLEHFDEEELDRIIAEPTFWQRNMERRAPRDEVTRPASVDVNGSTDVGLQLRLFDESFIDNPFES